MSQIDLEAKKRHEQEIKKLKAYAQSLEKKIAYDTAKYKRLVYDHNAVKYELASIKEKLRLTNGRS